MVKVSVVDPVAAARWRAVGVKVNAPGARVHANRATTGRDAGGAVGQGARSRVSEPCRPLNHPSHVSHRGLAQLFDCVPRSRDIATS